MASPAFEFYTQIYDIVVANLGFFWQGNGLANRGLGRVITSMILDTTRILMIMYVVFWGIAYVRGSLNETVAEAGWRMAKLTIIYAFAANFERFETFFGDFLWEMPATLADAINGRAGFLETGAGQTIGSASAIPTPASGASMMAALDQLMNNYITAGRLFNDRAYLNAGITGMPDLTLWLGAILLWGLGLVYTSYCAFLFIFCRLILAILLGFAPIFILTLMFPSTQRFFSMWMNQVVNYIVIFTLAAGLMALYTSVVILYMSDTAVLNAFANPNINQLLPPLVLAVIGLYIFVQVPKLSARLSEGVRLFALSSFAVVQARVQSYRA